MSFFLLENGLMFFALTLKVHWLLWIVSQHINTHKGILSRWLAATAQKSGI